ncbi:hypothetical protein [uncultured Hymenobacter sp.]|uniref:hypothetical protein n=1 Tax=uncultured Hymenobacter sp. TaxID=170016 RepID=UPI0035CB11AF
MFSSTKAGHFAHIFATAFLGQVAGNELVPPDPDKIEQYGHLVIQALVAIVTIWATVRKALQKPETVVKAPVSAVVVAPAGTPVASSPANSEADAGR